MVATGERRFRAAVEAGLAEIDCYFHEGIVSETEILEEQLVENLLREALNPLDEARGYAAMMDRKGWTGKMVASNLHVSESRVSRSLALLYLPADVQSQIESGNIPKTIAYELSKLDNSEIQQALAKQASENQMTKDQTIKAVRQRRGRPTSQVPKTKETFLTENGFKITVQGCGERNYHEIESALLEVLDEVRLRIDNLRF